MAGIAGLSAASSLMQSSAYADACGAVAGGSIRPAGGSAAARGWHGCSRPTAPDRPCRGFSGEQGSSFVVVQDYNKDQAEEDVANIRFTGESKARMLDFGADQSNMQDARYMGMASMARTNGIFGAIRSIGMAGYSMMGSSGGGSSSSAAQSGGWNWAGAGTNNASNMGAMNGP
ncbi:MAG: hypothetical protein ACHQPH_07695 [Reyranellales bacterium]|jgi:hypothetical protein